MFAEWDTSTKWCCEQDVEGRARCSFHKENVRSVRFVEKRNGCCCNLSSGVALNVWFTTNGMCMKNNNIHAWRKQAIIIEIATHVPFGLLAATVRSFAHLPRGFLIATVAYTLNKFCVVLLILYILSCKSFSDIAKKYV